MLQQEQRFQNIYQYTRCHIPEDVHLHHNSHLGARHGYVPHPNIKQVQFLKFFGPCIIATVEE